MRKVAKQHGANKRYTPEAIQRAYVDATAAVCFMAGAAPHVVRRSDSSVLNLAAAACEAVKALAHELGVDTNMPPWNDPVLWEVQGRPIDAVMADVIKAQSEAGAS